MAFLTPIQLLLWILALEVLSVPVIVFCVNAIMIAYQKIKQENEVKRFKAIGGTLEHLAKNMTSLKPSEDESEETK